MITKRITSQTTRFCFYIFFACLLTGFTATAQNEQSHSIRLNDEAVSLARQGKMEAAFRKISQASEISRSNDPTLVQNWVEIGRSLASKWMEQGKFSKAIDLLEDLRKKPGHQSGHEIRHQLAVTYNNYAVALSKKELYEQAENASTEADILAYGLEDRSIYNQVRQVHSRILTAWADELFSEGLGEQAKIKLLEAHRYDETYPDACRLLSRIYFDDGDYRQAVYYLELAAALLPEDAALQAELAQVKKESELDDNLRARKRYGFKVEFSGSEEYDLAGDVFEILGSAKKDIGRLFDYYPHETLLVKIYSPEHSAKVSAGPHWAAGLYDGKIRVRVDDVRKGGTRLKDILYHEYAHAVLFFLTRRNLPTWLNEGLAQNVEPGNRVTSREKKMVRQWLGDELYIPFEQMPRSFVSLSEEEAHRVYVQSRLFVDHLLDEQGEIRMRDALGRLRQGRSVDEAFQAAFGESVSDLERDWIREEL